MKIDKNIGNWSDDSTILDDYAYQLYINYMTETYSSDSNKGHQSNFIMSYNNFHENSIVYTFYKNAKLIIRKEKLFKLSNL